MSELNATVSATVNGSADKVYTVLADYRNHHPHILPQAYFTKLEVEEGGMGAGTESRTSGGWRSMAQI